MTNRICQLIGISLFLLGRAPYLGLMSRYLDRPMDFADGTLVYLAKREFLSVILTVDHADFATYRIEGKRQFRVLPADHP